MGEFAVIGIGMFGRNVALHLARGGQPVLAIDLDQEEVDRVAGELDSVVCADATDEAALRELRLERVSCAVVAIGAESMEASILATALLRQMGVPRIVARSLSELHARVLRAVGAHEVVSPEEEMGQRLARRLAEPGVLERMELGQGAELAEVAVPLDWVGESLVKLDIRRKYGVTVVAVRRGSAVRPTVDASVALEEGDVLIMIGEPAGIARVAALK
jgi:trk system potassium uptake protein TrkA